MNRKIGGSFQIPPASVNFLSAIGMFSTVTIYEKFLVPALRKATGNERGISILKRIGIGMVFTVIAMAAAALVEMKRLRVARDEMNILQGEAGKEIEPSISVFWLAPQYLILAVGDGFSLVGLQEYFYDQVPDSMRSLGIAFYLSILGVGNFLNTFLIIIVDHFTARTGGTWIGKDLNSSRLDNFYWLLTALTVFDLCGYVILARRYTYKNVQEKLVADSSKDVELMA